MKSCMGQLIHGIRVTVTSCKLFQHTITESYVYWTVHHCNRWRSCASACNTDTTQTQPHQISNTHPIENKTTDVVIQRHSRKLLMVDILMSETCWVHTYSKVQSPSWEANWFAASQEIPRILRNEGSLPHSQATATCLYPGPAQFSPYTHIPPPGDPS